MRRLFLEGSGQVEQREEKAQVNLPDPLIVLSGFPLCKGEGNTCPQEVQDDETLCPACGGPFLSPEIIKRTFLRQLRTAIRQILICEECKDKDLRGPRCLDCAFFSGAAYAIIGFMERFGWKSLSDPLADMIFVRQKKDA